ncbi:hypothetical protein D3C72_1237630 [compost metagenome]
MVDHALRRHGVAHHDRLAWAHDAGFLAANRFTVRPQQVHVIEIDTGDDGAVGVDDIGGIEPPTETDFQNGDIQLGQAQEAQNRQRRELEIGQRDFWRLQPRYFYCFKMRNQICGRHDLAPHAAALFKMHEMRRGEHARTIARLQGNRLCHGTGRALAIGACHGDHRAVKAQRQPLCHSLDTRQAHIDGGRVNLLAVGQPLIQGVESGLHGTRLSRN